MSEYRAVKVIAEMFLAPPWQFPLRRSIQMAEDAVEALGLEMVWLVDNVEAPPGIYRLTGLEAPNE